MTPVGRVGVAEFVSLDVETTGLHPQYLHRVVEVALCSFDAAGRQGDEYVTLVNPRRDVANTSIHGLSAEQLTHAPDFATVVGDVLHMLHGRVVVAHNAAFDLSFLDAELQRAGFTLPHLPSICTMTNCRCRMNMSA